MIECQSGSKRLNQMKTQCYTQYTAAYFREERYRVLIEKTYFE